MIEILRVCITGFILIIEAVTSGVSFFLFHYIFRTLYSVTIMFCYLSIHAVRVFTCLNNREPRWISLKIYYKLKFVVSILWICEISVILIVLKALFPQETLPLAQLTLSYIGSFLDLYFSYSIYSCMKLGLTGRLFTYPLPVSVQNLGTQPNDVIYVAREFKEVIAYPIPSVLPECEFVVVHDYTKEQSNN